MTLRTDEELDAALAMLADEDGISKQEVIRRAILAERDRRGRRGEIRQMTDDAIAEYGPLLDRLAQ